MTVAFIFSLLVVVAITFKQRGASLPAAPTGHVLHVGEDFPAGVELMESNGTKLHGSDFQKHAILINFWAGWCGPCLMEMPSLVEAQKTYQSRGLEVLAFDVDDDMKSGIKTMQSKLGNIPLRIFAGADSPVFRLFDISGVPFSVLVDKMGKIRFAEAGAANWMSAEMRAKIEGAL